MRDVPSYASGLLVLYAVLIILLIIACYFMWRICKYAREISDTVVDGVKYIGSASGPLQGLRNMLSTAAVIGGI